jgi:TonB-dependent SusC/RagA subfamily outer membrane receptor
MPSPLYVIDGIVSTQSDFAQISSNEIASVSILKDAASAAVFGVRGGNGIILVTTKRGVSGRTMFSYNY